MKYLDPKADLTFKKIFGKHPDLLTSLLISPRNSKALEELKISAFNEAELRAYDKFWDGVRVERTLQSDSYEEGLAEGREEGRAKGLAEGMEKGMAEGMEKGRAEGRTEGADAEKIATAKRMLSAGFTPEQVSVATSLSVDDVEKLS